MISSKGSILHYCNGIRSKINHILTLLTCSYIFTNFGLSEKYLMFIPLLFVHCTFKNEGLNTKVQCSKEMY